MQNVHQVFGTDFSLQKANKQNIFSPSFLVLNKIKLATTTDSCPISVFQKKTNK